MPSLLALLLCLGFVIFLLRLDKKQEPGLSGVVWIPTIWMCYIASKPLGIWFGSQGTTESGSTLDRVFQVALFGVGVLILGRRRFDWWRALTARRALLTLIVFMLVSILWSEVPFIALKRWTREAVAVTMALLALSERDSRSAFLAVLRRSVYILIPFSIVLAKYYPKYGVDFAHSSGARMWIGVTTQKNALGRLCLISGFWLLWTLFRRWRGRGVPAVKYQTVAEVIVLLITLVLLRGPGGAYSATALGALMLGLALFALLLWLKKQNRMLNPATLRVASAIIIVFGFLTPLVGGSNVAVLTPLLGRNSTLTGRTEIWADLVPVAMRNPILGTGFGSFWTSDTIDELKEKECHNGYLEVFLATGIVGVLLASAFLLTMVRDSQRAMTVDFDWGSFCVCIVIMTLAHNITESSIDSFARQLMAVVLFLSFSVSEITDTEEAQAEDIGAPDNTYSSELLGGNNRLSIRT